VSGAELTRRSSWRHLNKLRWLSLLTVFSLLLLLPLIAVYQNLVAAHAYDLLLPAEKRLYDVMAAITGPFVSDPAVELDQIKGTTWSASFYSYQISDPLAVFNQLVASRSVHWPFVATALIPLLLTLLLGRFFCGWICPATLLYELNTNLGVWLEKLGLPIGRRQFDRRIKYALLGLGLLVSAAMGSVLLASIYPPAVIGREAYYSIAQGGFGAGAIFFLLTMTFDLLVARRGFCRYLCPGGALYSLLGRYRLVRIQRTVQSCNDCGKCDAVCEFGLEPQRDDFGQECNNCSACIAVCPTDALTFAIRIIDQPAQGPGHLGRQHREQENTA
jgi:ferredoxin-type protein NapH